MHFTAFDNSDALANWLADHTAKKLAAAVAAEGKASLAVSGGSTPISFFRALSTRDIAWENVTILLVDERWVPPASKRSNQRLVTLELLQDKAAAAHLLPLYSTEIELEDIATRDRELVPHLPVDVMVLGMGADGHTASLFPGGSNLGSATSEECDVLLISMEAEDAGEPRVTITLPVIASATDLILHIEGEEKRSVLEEADKGGDPARLPIRFVLAKRPDLRVVWAP